MMPRSPVGSVAKFFWVACAVALSACGGGSSDRKTDGSVTLDPPVSNSTSFDTKTSSPFIAGAAPFGAQFTGGTADGSGAWLIAEGETATIDFTTPADQVVLSTVANIAATATAPVSAKTGGSPAVPRQAVNAPFTVPMYVRGSIAGDWAVDPSRLLTEEADNLLSVVLPIEPGDYEFKVADAGWTGATNCGADTDPTAVTVGVTFTMQCDALSQNLLLTIATGGDYKFTFNVSDPEATTINVARFTSGGGDDGGGGEPEPMGIKVRLLDPAGNQINAVEDDSGAVLIDETRRGGDSRIARVEIENVGQVQQIGVQEVRWTADPRNSPAAISTAIHYRSPSGDYTNTTIVVDGKSYGCVADSFGCVATGISALPYTALTYTVNDGATSETVTAFPGDGSQQVYTFAGSGAARLGQPAGLPASADEVILYYFRPDGNYTGWGLHLFPVQPQTEAWTLFPTPGEYLPAGTDPVYGAYFRIRLPQDASPSYSNNPADLADFPEVLGLIIHKGDAKDPGPDQFIRIADGNIVFVVSGVNDVSTVPPGGAAAARISGASAHWVNASTLLWSPPAGVTKVRLLASADASIKAGIQGLQGTYDSYVLTSTSKPTLDNQRHLSTLSAWALPAAAVTDARELARRQLVAVGYDADDVAVAGTLVQTAGVLDDLYADAADGAALGVTYSGSAPTLAVWAPTALTDPGVSVKVYEANGSFIEEAPMTLDPETGVWSVTGTAAWDRKFYTINLQVYSYAVDGIVGNEVTDPYSVSLATDSVRSQFVNLEDADLKPAGWDTLVKPALEAPEDIVVYELHVRDFSIADSSVPDADRGKFTAFDVPGTAGRQHLEALASAGLTHAHILPAFDIATIKENPAERVELGDPVEKLCAAVAAAASLCQTDAGKTIRQAMTDAVSNGQLERPQQIAGWLRGLDGFNWGYDPLHFGAPEGSYATDPDGAQRILDFRRMVKGLADAGLGTIMDVVYNHTNASGQSPKSVLDRVVPGYYHRRDAVTGNVLRDSCCDDTAVEFRMMEKLMTDTGVRWVSEYKVDGFRFDLMSFHTKASMLRFQTAVKAVNPTVYIYGEGWNFGAIQNDKRFLAARQANLGGTGIGSFSDRIRDPVRGGGPFDSGNAHIKNQGFISGWYYDPNSENTGSNAERLALIEDTDNIRVWMAGGLKSFSFQNFEGATTRGQDVDYRGQDSGYTEDPQEAINYISKHDNETLWDLSQYKHPANTPLADRVRAQNVGLSIVLLGQGIPFLHAGSDIIRSKSMDRNSYDSGDWFNELDWTLSGTKWNQGLPLEGDNQASWDAQLTATVFNVNAVPNSAAQQAVFAQTQELLQIRKSSPLFRLRTGAEVEKRVTFENTGPFQVPGVIAMRIDGCTDPSGLSPADGALMVIINASDDPRTLGYYPDETWTLHPVLAASADPVVRTAGHDANGFSVPARTTAVFVRAEQNSCAPYPRELFVRGVNGDWSDNPERKFVFLGGVDYSATFPVNAGSQQFKVADANWTGDTNCGAPSGGLTARLGVPAALYCANDSGNIPLDAPVTGDYTFSLDATNTASPVLTVAKTPPTSLALYVRGVTGDWSANPARVLAWDGVSKGQVVIDGLPANEGQQFKIADADWGGTTGGATNCGAGASPTVTPGTPYALNCDNSSGNLELTLPTAGSWLFSVDYDSGSPFLTVEKTPFDLALYLRGLNNDWSSDPPNRFAYTGGGVYRISKILGAGADDFKIADADWGGSNGGATNCGAPDPVVIGAALPIDCSSNSANINFNPAAPGSYVFELTVPGSGTPSLLVTGP